MKTIEYKGYVAEVGIDLENELFYGNVFGARDVISFNGKTTHQLIKNFEEAIDNYVEYCEEEGIEPEKPYSGKFNVRIDPSTHKKLAKQAFQSEMSLNDLVKSALEKEVSKNVARRASKKVTRKEKEAA